MNAASDAPMVYDTEVYVTFTFRTLDDGTVERLFYVRADAFERVYFWVRYPAGSPPASLPEGPDQVAIKFRLGLQEGDDPEVCGYLLAQNGEFAIVSDAPQHKLTRKLS